MKKTPLQVRLHKLTSSISKIGLLVDILLVVILLVSYFRGNSQDEREISVFSRAVGIFADALSTIIVVIPEGLPFAVTPALYDSLKRMVANQALVRKMSACQPDCRLCHNYLYK